VVGDTVREGGIAFGGVVVGRLGRHVAVLGRKASAGCSKRSVSRRLRRLAVLVRHPAGGAGVLPVAEASGGSPGGEEGERVGGPAALLDAERADEQPWLAGQLEHVRGDVDLAPLGMAVDLASGPVVVDVLVGPVLAELGAER
jgi:hypothetical protein